MIRYSTQIYAGKHTRARDKINYKHIRCVQYDSIINNEKQCVSRLRMSFIPLAFPPPLPSAAGRPDHGLSTDLFCREAIRRLLPLALPLPPEVLRSSTIFTRSIASSAAMDELE